MSRRELLALPGLGLLVLMLAACAAVAALASGEARDTSQGPPIQTTVAALEPAPALNDPRAWPSGLVP